MELEQIKNLWNDKNISLEQNLKINTELLKEVSMHESKKKLGEFKWENIIELISYIVLGIYTVSFLVDNYMTPKFSIPAMVLLLLSIVSIYWNIYGLRFVYLLNFNTPIVALQRKLAKLRYYTLMEGRLMLILVPLFILSLSAVVFKGVLDLDMYQLFSRIGWGYIALNTFIGAVIVWLIVRKDYKRFDEVNQFLQTIEQYENEDE